MDSEGMEKKGKLIMNNARIFNYPLSIINFPLGADDHAT